jgi:hypothetical protein
MDEIKRTMNDILNMVVWKAKYDEMVENNLVIGPKLHIKIPKMVPIEVCAPTEDIMMELYSPKRERMDSMDTCGPTPKRRRIDTELEWQLNYPGSPRIWLSPAPTPSPRHIECWGCENDEPNQMAHACLGYEL